MQHQVDSHLLSLVCIAAPDDSVSLAHWETHLLPLQQTGWLSFWSEHVLQAGDERKALFTEHLDQADTIILLLSADFFASEECLTLMDYALHRSQDGTAKVIPLLVRPALWRESPLGMLACLPANEIPVLSWERQDEGWHACILGLQQLLGVSSSRALQTPASKRDHSDRGRLLRWLSLDYQRDLDEMLQHLAWLEPGLTEQPDVVRNAIHLLARRPDRSERALPAGTSVLDVYDQAEEALLILGDPGAGKSTLLRDLALQLITRAQEDDTHPLPVILPLSSWAVKKPALSDWVVDQLARIYDVPRRLGQQWVNQDQILPLLDGLDEMEEVARPLCIAAINTYRRAHFTPLVVCSRSVEYQAAAIDQRLVLQNAVVVQPLTQEQVDQTIQRGGAPLAALHKAFRDNQELRDLATTPLMLSVLVLAYYGTAVSGLPQQQATLERQVWTDYVERTVREKGSERQGKQDVPVKCYSLEQTHCWLSWLAQQMREHNQTLFYGEYLQEDWLPATQQRAVKWLVIRLPAMLLGVLISLLLTSGLGSSNDPRALFQSGLIGGFLGWCFCRDQRETAPAMVGIPQKSLKGQTRQGQHSRPFGAVLLAFLFAVGFGLPTNIPYDYDFYTVSGWFREGIIYGISIVVSAWLLQLLFDRVSRSSMRPLSRWSHLFGWVQTTPGCRALWTGIILGTGTVLGDWLTYWLGGGFGGAMNSLLHDGLERGWIYVLISWLNGTISWGVSYGSVAYLISSILDIQTGTLRLAEQVHWKGSCLLQWHHLRASFYIALACVCFFGLGQGLATEVSGVTVLGLGYGLRAGLIPGVGGVLGLGLYGLRAGLISGLALGLGVALNIGLSYWLLLGLYQGITQEHLNDLDRRQFNQGIRRSLRNGALLSLLSAGIIGVILVLSRVLSIGLEIVLMEGLMSGQTEVLSWSTFSFSQGLASEQSIVWLVVLCGWLVVWAATGGLTILRHYVLRLLLAHSHTFPLHTRRFLDDARARVLLRRVGGGYSFVHRRLLDYFADTTLLSADTSQAPPQTLSAPQSMVASLPGTTTSEGLQDKPFPPQDEGRER